MTFVKKVWKDRQVQYPNRRTINDGYTTKVVTVGRDEGTITEVGDSFNATNMNDLENRILAACGGGGGGGGFSGDYGDLYSKPKINNVELSGNKTTADLHISYNDLEDTPTIPTVANILNTIYPVGSIYISVSSANPGLTFGGTWSLFGAGKTLVGVDTGDADFNAAEKTGGEKTHTLTVNEMPSHNHDILKPRWSTSTGANAVYGSNGTGSGSDYDDRGYQGGGEAHNNMQPYITVYFWERES